MNRRYMYAVCTATLVLTACGTPGDSNAGGERSATARGTESGSEAIEHTGFGTVNAIDRALATVNVSHAAVASADWPAMTMDFKLADPGAAADLSAGDRIEFRFTTEEGGTITAVEPLP
jgi:Cu/Ag efflux protein CusF